MASAIGPSDVGYEKWESSICLHGEEGVRLCASLYFTQEVFGWASRSIGHGCYKYIDIAKSKMEGYWGFCMAGICPLKIYMFSTCKNALRCVYTHTNHIKKKTD